VIYLSGCVRDDLAPEMGVMVTPMMGNRLPALRRWAADTGCFSQPERHDDDAYIAWLAERDSARCLFATAPDVVGDADATLARSAPMLTRIREAGYRSALVGQDGLRPDMLPWENIDAFFVGGSTAWKLGEAAADLVREANARGKWTHMGRVNSERRVMYAKSIGCKSVDGTYIAFGPDINGPRVCSWMRRATMQQALW
jgi:hypothetical protein